ncbi:hypothetical protein CGI62_23400 [Vibrio parahaemolyticus]|nr:hypothetical protein CGI62_23400 [Vibrio parahaemolyticus]
MASSLLKQVIGKNEQSYNKAFKSDSQRLAVSLRSSIAKRCSHLNAALYALWKMIQKGRYEVI